MDPSRRDRVVAQRRLDPEPEAPTVVSPPEIAPDPPAVVPPHPPLPAGPPPPSNEGLVERQLAWLKERARFERRSTDPGSAP